MNMGVRYAQMSSAVIATAIAVVISVISFQYFERFFLKFKSRYAS
jgi:hypothetical protein